MSTPAVDAKGLRKRKTVQAAVKQDAAAEEKDVVVADEEAAKDDNEATKDDNEAEHEGHTEFVPRCRGKHSSKTNAGFGKCKYLLFVLLMIAVAGGGGYFFASGTFSNVLTNSKEPSHAKDGPRNCTFAELRTAYAKQPATIWRHLRPGVETILRGLTDHPAVFLFLHDRRTNIDALVERIADYTAKCFNEDGAPAHMTLADFNGATDAYDEQYDYGTAIQRYTESMETADVMVLPALNKVPAVGAQALHYICDTVSPLLASRVVFMTLGVDVLPAKSTDIATTAITTLKHIWKELQPNQIDAIVTRVVEMPLVLHA